MYVYIQYTLKLVFFKKDSLVLCAKAISITVRYHPLQSNTLVLDIYILRPHPLIHFSMGEILALKC